MNHFTDRIAVVTGAAGGIGRATAIALARAGCHLALADVNRKGLEETAAAIRRLNRRASVHEVDVADEKRVEWWAGEVIRAHGAVHILINNAGISCGRSFAAMDAGDFDRVMAVNFRGTVYGCRYFLPHLKAAPEAHIVNLSSLFGILGVSGRSAYCASKFALRGFSEALQMELKRDGIGVTTVHPGAVNTGIAAAGPDAASNQAMIKALNRGASPEQVADQIVAAIRKNDIRRVITRGALVLDGLKRLAPEQTQRLLGRLAARFKPAV